MKNMVLARRLSELGETSKAVETYILALKNEKLDAIDKFECAYYILNNDGDYKISYTIFIELYNEGLYQKEIFDILLYAFYEPNYDKIRKQYELNCKLLKKYPYIFKKEYIEFDDLNIKFFPFDDDGYIPYYVDENRFGEYFNPNETIIKHYFFRDLSKPILGQEVYSQYELEYLYDNVRKSEWVGYENHIYICYKDIYIFLNYLQILDMKKILKGEKFIFLFGDEIKKYPIDFKKDYNIDFSQYPLKPIGIREVNKLIWHTQLSGHNGGDFFDEILYGHPNLLTLDSIMLYEVDKAVEDIINNKKNANNYYIKKLKKIKNYTFKDVFVTLFLDKAINNSNLSLNLESRIVPAIVFQPHFHNIVYELHSNGELAKIDSEQYRNITNSVYFKDFKYIKTFTPLRRPTTSYSATVKFKFTYKNNRIFEEEDSSLTETYVYIIKNRSFMIDKFNRLFKDSRLVRFEDGKLNSKATFTALAQFLDIPYTESMTYCSGKDGKNPISLEGNVVGFDTDTVYRTYDEFANDKERAYIEYFMKDVYNEYGYDYKYCKVKNITEEEIDNLDENFTKMPIYVQKCTGESVNKEQLNIETEVTKFFLEERKRVMKILLKNPIFVNDLGQPLVFMKKLELDETLLETELYR